MFREGDPPTTAFLIEQGSLRITTQQNSQTLILGDIGRGALVGEMAVLDDSTRSATVTALEHCVLTPIDRDQFAERLDSADPVLRALLLSQLARYRAALATFGGAAPPVVGASEANGDRPGANDKIRLEIQLRQALELRKLDLELQPILDISTGRIAGFEALTRWNHPERGPISPAEFIALAEETSLIVPVGDYVLDAVCGALQQCAALKMDRLPFIALNVSGRQLQDEKFIEHLAARAISHGVAPAQLQLEITESLVLDYAKVDALILRAHHYGIRVALDDFGTGYSNLSHLHRLAFDTLKLDQGFVRQLEDPRCLAIVRAVVEMARALGCDIVAEGVETQAQLTQLTALDCEFAQGYFIGRPQAIPAALGAFAADTIQSADHNAA